MTNLKTVDNFLQSKKKLTNPTMIGANNNQVNGQSTNSKLFSSVTGENLAKSALNTVVNGNSVTDMIKDTIDKNNSQK